MTLPNPELFGRRKRFVLLLSVWGLCLGGAALMLAIPESRAWAQGHLGAFLAALEKMTFWGPIIVGALFIPVALLLLPGSLLTLFGGFAFGRTAPGFLGVCAAVSVGSTLGAYLSFLLARAVRKRFGSSLGIGGGRARALGEALAEGGFRLVLLSRLSPVLPYNLLNYMFGATRVRPRDYVLGTWLGMLPGTIMYIYLGATLGSLADVLAGRAAAAHPAREVLFYAGLAATAVVFLLLTRAARRAWQNSVDTAERGGHSTT
jgi:uncharacterized membrane protein YdjX (TVP38/TMEM64 family)